CSDCCPTPPSATVPPPPPSTLFPYTTLFRSRLGNAVVDRAALVVVVGAACEAPRIIVVRPGRDVAGAAHVNGAHRGPSLAVYARDRKSTRLNSSHEWISYAVFSLKHKPWKTL